MSGIATAVVGGSVLSSVIQSEAASEATGAQTEASRAAIGEQRSQFNQIQEMLAPYISAGNTALTQQQALIGLGGPEAQQGAISSLEASPQFGALVRQGEEGILQSASATGGLRGGNTQAALAQFRPQVLSQLIESQYSKLGGIAQQGQASAAGVGAAGMGAAGNIGNFMQQGGLAQGQGVLAQGQIGANLVGDISQQLGRYLAKDDTSITPNPAGQTQAGGRFGGI